MFESTLLFLLKVGKVRLKLTIFRQPLHNLARLQWIFYIKPDNLNKIKILTITWLLIDCNSMSVSFRTRRFIQY